MDQKRRSRIAGGLLLVLLGVCFLVAQFVPELQTLFSSRHGWPLGTMAFGVLLLLVGLLTWTPGLVMAACVIGGIGCLLYWQNLTGIGPLPGP